MYAPRTPSAPLARAPSRTAENARRGRSRARSYQRLSGKLTGVLARNRFAFALAAIAVVGLAVREFYVLHWLQGHRWGGDGIEFHLLAATLLDSHTYSEP